MVQMDGSHHDWLEGRGSKLVLMAYIDDATSTAYAKFYDYEGTLPAMDSFKGYVRKYGLPISVYLDRHTTYALKHAFPEGKGGEINITMRLEDNQVALTVQDNGMGLPDAVDFQNTQSLGLELVNLLVGQLNGTISLEVDGGTTFTIIFPAGEKGG